MNRNFIWYKIWAYLCSIDTIVDHVLGIPVLNDVVQLHNLKKMFYKWWSLRASTKSILWWQFSMTHGKVSRFICGVPLKLCSFARLYLSYEMCIPYHSPMEKVKPQVRWPFTDFLKAWSCRWKRDIYGLYSSSNFNILYIHDTLNTLPVSLKLALLTSLVFCKWHISIWDVPCIPSITDQVASNQPPYPIDCHSMNPFPLRQYFKHRSDTVVGWLY